MDFGGRTETAREYARRSKDLRNQSKHVMACESGYFVASRVAPQEITTCPSRNKKLRQVFYFSLSKEDFMFIYSKYWRR